MKTNTNTNTDTNVEAKTNIEAKTNVDTNTNIDTNKTIIEKDKMIKVFIYSFIISSGLLYFGVYLANL